MGPPEPSGSVAGAPGPRRHGVDLVDRLVESTGEYAVFASDPEGCVATWNPGAVRITGYEADEIVGHHFSRSYTEEDRRDGVPDNGLTQALAITALHGADGTHRGFAKVTRDLTDRKRAEDALRGVLERERETAARLQELDRMKNELVSVIAHDLRGPVEVVEALLVLLRDDWTTTPEEERLALVERAAARVQAIGDFVDDVFDLARIEAGELRVEPDRFDLAPVIAQVVDDVAVSAPDRSISVDVEAGLWALGDDRRTWQVLSNIISNATKFSPPGSPITISVERAGKEVVVSVTDQGSGIPEEQQPLLFQRFVRLPQTKGTPGSGMGLFIARSLVEAQGGRMWVTSSPGAGATFHVALPAAPA